MALTLGIIGNAVTFEGAADLCAVFVGEAAHVFTLNIYPGEARILMNNV
jgi:hypothetical protein